MLVNECIMSGENTAQVVVSQVRYHGVARGIETYSDCNPQLLTKEDISWLAKWTVLERLAMSSSPRNRPVTPISRQTKLLEHAVSIFALFPVKL